MRAVLDTNVIISSVLNKTGPSAQVVRRLEAEDPYELLLSEPLLGEYRKVLMYNRLRALHHQTDQDIDSLLENLRGLGIMVESDLNLDVIKEDPSDNKLLECAIAGGADYIISGDKDLLRLREYEGVLVLPPAAFLAVLNADSA